MKRKPVFAAACAAAVLALARPRPCAAAESPLPPVYDPSAVDKSADPCRDFYQYACGAWLEENPVPADQPIWYRFQELDEHTRGVLRAILAEAAAEKDRTSPDSRKIGDYYEACMDKPAIEAKGLAPLEPELAKIDAVKDARGLAPELAQLHLLGANALFSFTSAQDYQDASRMIADADQGGFALPDRDYYLQDEFKEDRTAYTAHLQKMFVLLGEQPVAAAAHAGAVLRVETALAKAAMDRVSRREPKNVHHKMTLAALERLTPRFDWKAYLAAVGSPEFSSLDVSDPGFFKGMNAALASVPLDDWKTYLRWTLLHAEVSALPSRFVEEDFDFFGRRLSGQKQLKARWKRCVASSDGELGEALGKAYVEREFSPAAKERVLWLVREIEAAMRRDIESSPWMSAATKKRALVKLSAVANKIGYPDKWRDYSKLAVAPDDALGNLERGNAFELRRELGKIGKPVDRTEWEMTPPTDNAYYDPQMNDINFPAGILQPPNFDVRAGTAVVLGALGATVGHELTHGFDDEGRHYDAKGNLKDWWTKADEKAFQKRAQAFVDEYSQFVTVSDPKDPAKDVRLNGRLTLGENIADNGGLLLAYDVLEREAAAGAVKTEDGLTPQQRFFLGYGQSWCVNMTNAYARKAAKVDPHATGRWRVDGVVSNMPQFAQAFSCPAGSPMAGPPRRVW